MSARNVELLRAAHVAFNRRDFAAITTIIADHCVYHDRPRGIRYHGPAEFRAFLEEWVRAFSDSAITDPQYLDAGDTVVALIRGTGTNDGAFGPLPPSRKRMDMPLCEIVRFNEQGKMVAGELYYDQLTMLTQLGHMQPQTAALPV